MVRELFLELEVVGVVHDGLPGNSLVSVDVEGFSFEEEHFDSRSSFSLYSS